MESSDDSKQMIQDLPDSIILHLFSFLDKKSLCLGARITCQRWHKISKDPDLWRVVEIPHHFTDNRFYMLLEQIHEHLETLECSNCENLTSVGFYKTIQLNFPRLKSICMPIMNTLSSRFYESLTLAAPILEEIDNIFANDDDPSKPLQTQSLFPKLKVLHDKPIAWYGRIRGSESIKKSKLDQWQFDVNATAALCSDITSYICKRGFDYLDNAGLSLISDAMPFLEKVELNYCSFDDAGLEVFFMFQRGNLKELIIEKPKSLTEHGLKLIGDKCSKLVSLKLSRCPGLTNGGLEYIASKCPDLEELHINNSCNTLDEDKQSEKKCEINDDVLFAVGEHCPKLRFFKILYSSQVTTAGIQALVTGCPNLVGIMLYECSEVNDETIDLLMSLKHLKGLTLVHCNKITPRKTIMMLLKMESLRRLTLFTSNPEFCSDMNDLAEDIYAEIDQETTFTPPILKRLTVKGVGSGFVQLITVMCPQLDTFSVLDKCKVGAWSLGTVLKNCEQLSTLDIHTVTGLKDNFLDSLCSNGTNLREINFGQNVEGFTMSGMKKLLSCCPSLQLLAMDTQGSALDCTILHNYSKTTHGGQCFLHLDPDTLIPNERYPHHLIELHMMPMKYLPSFDIGTAKLTNEDFSNGNSTLGRLDDEKMTIKKDDSPTLMKDNTSNTLSSNVPETLTNDEEPTTLCRESYLEEAEPLDKNILMAAVANTVMEDKPTCCDSVEISKPGVMLNKEVDVESCEKIITTNNDQAVDNDPNVMIDPNIDVK